MGWKGLRRQNWRAPDYICVRIWYNLRQMKKDVVDMEMNRLCLTALQVESGAL